ncbi:hypothetical protein FOXYS1_10781 [Fusarium oxysporum]|uniref:Uncharacterized protein n=1 Tax=Fusarium oxysporum TaxID=5507 RepID=A0A8H5A4Q9_FUSOX|nr:hypothetical protein FOXYS1_10781 [Fusarium oxysporum]
MVASASSKSALAAVVAAEAVGAVAETAFAAAVAVKGAVTTATASMVTAKNSWNLVGWMLVATVVGARETAPQSITWDCYKSIIHEAVDKPAEQMLLTALFSRPMVVRVGTSNKTTSIDLPDIEMENVTGELYLLQGVALPWGAVAYHADRMEE